MPNVNSPGSSLHSSDRLSELAGIQEALGYSCGGGTADCTDKARTPERTLWRLDKPDAVLTTPSNVTGSMINSPAA